MSSARHVALLVEDDLETANRVKDLLSVLGFDYRHAATQEAALALVEEGGFCFALLDLQIPRNEDSIMAHVEAGQSVLDAIRARYDEKNKKKRMHWLPALIMTAFAKEADYIVEMMGRGADGYLIKPFGEMTKLADTIRDALERSERDDHGHCGHITRRARGEQSPTSASADRMHDGRTVDEPLKDDAPRIEPVRLTVTGASRGRRTEILIDEQQVEVTNANFIVLFNLIAGALRTPDRWVKEESLGPNGSKAIYRLKQELKPHVHKRVELAECEKGCGNYRLSPQVKIGRVDCARLANHDEQRVRELAAEIAKMSNAASRAHQSA